ncbi:restriction endonuclease subunit S [Vibrio vulnificus]
MGANTTIYTVQELVDLGIIEKPLDGNHGGIHPKSSDYVESGIPFVMASDLINGHVDTVNCKFISEEQAKTLRKGFAKEGDVLLSHKATIGRTAVVGKLDTEFVVLTPQVTYYRVTDRLKLNPQYLKYYFDSAAFQTLFEQWAGGGSTRLYLGITGQMKLPIELPDVNTQNLIVDVINSFDQKITLNRQINQTLEQMAQTLFKSWFVDFDPVIDNALDAGNPIPDELQHRALIRQEQRKAVRQGQAAAEKECEGFKPLPDDVRQLFPDAFEESELGWMPKGWDVKTCEEISTRIGMGPFGSNIKASTFVDSGVPIINGQQLKGFLLEDTFSNFVTQEHSEKLSNSSVGAGDIVFTHRGTIGQVSLIPAQCEYEKYIVSQSQFFLRPNPAILGSHYLTCFFKSTLGQQRLLSNASQVGVPAIARPSSHLKQLKVIVPKHNTQAHFEMLVDAYIKSIVSLDNQLKTLTKLRDTLLPKLISGELRLDDAEAVVEQETVDA